VITRNAAGFHTRSFSVHCMFTGFGGDTPNINRRRCPRDAADAKKPRLGAEALVAVGSEAGQFKTCHGIDDTLMSRHTAQ
jgi:hypothetical protein